MTFLMDMPGIYGEVRVTKILGVKGHVITQSNETNEGPTLTVHAHYNVRHPAEHLTRIYKYINVKK